MLDYNWFGYRPDYGFELYCNGELIDRSDKVVDAACFSRVFACLRRKWEIYKGTYTLRCRKKFKAQSGNYCSLERFEIIKILRYMRKAFDIKITLRETDANFIFDFCIEGKPIKHKFVLTFSRVFFEYPYNEMAKDVFRMRSLGKVNGVDFSHKSFLEMYNLLWCTYMSYFGGGHSLFCYPTADTHISTLKKAFEVGLDRVQAVYDGEETLYDRTRKNKLNPDDIDWTINFESRVSSYSKNFEIIKKYKSEQRKKGIRRRARKVIQ